MPDELEKIRQLEERMAERRRWIKEQDEEVQAEIREAEQRHQTDKTEP